MGYESRDASWVSIVFQNINIIVFCFSLNISKLSVLSDRVSNKGNVEWDVYPIVICYIAIKWPMYS